MRDGAPIAEEYPLIFRPSHAGRVVTAGEGEEVWSACAILERDLVSPGKTIRAGLIGSVSTASERRGQGLASVVLQGAEQALRDGGCLFSMLWAVDAAFYERRGYQEIGAEVDFVLPASAAGSLPPPDGVRSATAADFSAMHELYLSQQRRVARTEGESAVLYTSPGMAMVVCESSTVPGEIDAYACIGRGLDLQGVTHEWAGRVDAVLACVRFLVEAGAGSNPGSELFLMSPVPCGEVGSRLHELGLSSARGILGMARLLDPETAARELAEAADRPVAVSRCSETAWLLESAGRTARVADESLLTLLLAPRADRTELVALEAELGLRFPELPWTPFLWGLDSI